MNNIELKKNERLDDLQRSGYMIIQNSKKFCFGVDAVLLSNFAIVNKGDKVIDLGTGTGVIPILLEAKSEGSYFLGIDIQEESVEMASRSVEYNKLQEKVKIELADIKEASNIYKNNSFDVVTSNPPYMNTGGGIVNEHSAKAIARHEVLCSLEDVVYNASKLLREKGRFYMVHRPQRLVDIICSLRKNLLEPKTIRFVHSNVDKEANMVLIESVKGGGPLLKTLKPLFIYNKNGEYSEEIKDMYK